MGKLEGNSLINHFSHEHPLRLENLQARKKTTCSACKRSVSGSFYACVSCNFYLHKKCSDLPQTLKHESDRHYLVLLSSPAYPEGVFKCNACGTHGNGFSYHCPDCQLDLHTACASMPLSIDHASHGHTLGLCFRPPYANQEFSCDICKQPGSNHWLYRCGLCEFDAHMNCAKSTTTSRVVALPKSTSLPPYKTNHFSPPPPPRSPTPQPPLVQIFYSSPAQYPQANHDNARTTSQGVLNKSASLPPYETNHFLPPPPPPAPIQPYYCQAQAAHHPQANHYQVAPSTMGVPKVNNGFMTTMAGHAVEGLVSSVVEAVIEGIVS